MLVHTTREKILKVAKDNFNFAQELMVCVGRQLYTLTRDIESYALQTAKQRLAGYLLRQSLTPETLSRLLHNFSSEGLITVVGRRIKILDDERLGALLSA